MAAGRATHRSVDDVQIPAGGLHAPHTLTEFELAAINEDVNVADGHPRQALSPSQEQLIGRLPQMFEMARTTQMLRLETAAHAAFMNAVGQQCAPVGTGRMLSCYASSVGIDVVARCVARVSRKVGLIHPTLDNIADLLKARDAELVPVEETDLEPRLLERLGGRDLDCLFITTPNNPTGFVVEEARLAEIAEFCAMRDVVLVLDTSFRGFDRRAQYDTYAVLDRAGVEYVVIEDTGKLWPVLELKLGIVAFSAGNRLGIERAMADVLLSVSPVVLVLVEALARDAAEGGFAQLHDLIEHNRAALREAIRDVDPLYVLDIDTRISVERIGLREPLSARAVWTDLARRGVHVLPCGPFHWARPHEGDAFVRLALGRSPEIIERAASGIRQYAETSLNLAGSSLNLAGSYEA